MIGLEFKTGVPDVKRGGLDSFIVMTHHEKYGDYVFPAYYLNAHHLEYQDGCGADNCSDTHDDGCPTTGWFNDESNFEYDNCYHRLNVEVVAWAALPSAEEVRAALANGESGYALFKGGEQIGPARFYQGECWQDAREHDGVVSIKGDAQLLNGVSPTMMDDKGSWGLLAGYEFRALPGTEDVVKLAGAALQSMAGQS